MRMMGHRRAPGVEHGGEADAGAEMLWISADREQRLGRGAEQQVVDHRLVLIGDRGDLGRQCEDHVEVVDRQQVGLARGEPILRRRTLALGTMAVAARVVGDPAVAAILTALDMTAEGSRAAALDGRHHLELAEAHMPGIGPAPGGAMVMEDAAWASASPARKSRRNRRESTRTGKRKPGLHCTQRVPSNDIPPPGTIMWRCGWWVIAEPQVWSTAVRPMRAPRCLGSVAMVSSVSAAVRNSRS